MLGIYARQSIEKNTTNSIDDQIAKGVLYAVTLNLDYKIYIDRGESAIKNNISNRKGVQELIKDVEAKIITAIFVYDLSRLTRNDKVNGEFLEIFTKFDVKIHSIIDGITDVKDTKSVFMNKLKAIINEQTVRENALKIKSVLELRASQGKAPGGWLKAMGYTTDNEKMLVIDEEEAEIINEVYDLCLKGHGSGKIAEILNERGVLTKSTRQLLKSYGEYSKIPEKYGIKAWAPNTVLSILKNPLYKGERIHVGKTFNSPIIIKPEIWDLAQIQINQNRNSHSSSKHTYLLNKLCYCGRCGSNISGKTRESKRDHFYKCASKVKKKSCGLRSINIDTLDSIVWLMIVKDDLLFNKAKKEVANLKNPQFLNELNKDKKKIEKELNHVLNAKNNAFNFLNKGIYDEAEAEKIMREANVKITDLKKQLRDINLKLDFNIELTKQIDEVEELVRNWENLVFTDNFDLQYEVVRLFVNNIIVNFDDAEDMYTINISVKIPEYSELITFFVDSKGEPHESNKNGNTGGKKLQERLIEVPQKFTNQDYSANLTSSLLPPLSTVQRH